MPSDCASGASSCHRWTSPNQMGVAGKTMGQLSENYRNTVGKYGTSWNILYKRRSYAGLMGKSSKSMVEFPANRVWLPEGKPTKIWHETKTIWRLNQQEFGLNQHKTSTNTGWTKNNFWVLPSQYCKCSSLHIQSVSNWPKLYLYIFGNLNHRVPDYTNIPRIFDWWPQGSIGYAAIRSCFHVLRYAMPCMENVMRNLHAHIMFMQSQWSRWYFSSASHAWMTWMMESSSPVSPQIAQWGLLGSVFLGSNPN